MLEITGNIWDIECDGRCITTNGIIKQNGYLVMGKGIAYEAAVKYPKLPLILGEQVSFYGNLVFHVPQYKLFSFPTKHHWKDKSDIKLIEKSVKSLVNQVNLLKFNKILLPRPGCGNGGLDWVDVKGLLSDLLDDRFVIVSFK